MNCPKCGLMNTGNLSMGLAMPQCMCQWQSPAPQPKREWVGLTVKEANELWESTDSDWELMKRVEAKLKEKNT